MTTFLLTWNPEKWAWDNLEEASQQTAYRDNWTCGNTKRIRKQGREPRGILASGWVVSDEVFTPLGQG